MKRRLPLLLLFLFAVNHAFAQVNHLPNASFETRVQCPTSHSQVTQSIPPWWQYTKKGTSDYYNTCSFSIVGIPANQAGWQMPFHGNAYTGAAATYKGLNPGPGNYREYLAAHMLPLQIGAAYEVSMYVSLGNGSEFASNGLGMFFYDNGPDSIDTDLCLAYKPQVLYPQIVTDTQNWVRLSQRYFPDSAYDHVIIGIFHDDTTITKLPVQSLASNMTYYYFDSVSVKKINYVSMIAADTLACVGDTFSVQYYSNVKKVANNVFKVQLSNAGGVFNAPVDIGTITADTNCTIFCTIPINTPAGAGYKIRVVSSNAADTIYGEQTIKIGNPLNLTFSVASPVCEGDNIAFFTNAPTGAKYNWTGPNSFASTSSNPIISAFLSSAGKYYSNVQYYGCTVLDTFDIQVKPSPAKPDAVNNGPMCAGQPININATTTTAGITWSWSGPLSYTSSQQNNIIPSATTAMSGDYIVTVDLNGCKRMDTTTVTVKPMPAATTLNTNAPVCAGTTLQLNSTASTTGVAYTWDGPNAFAATTQSATVGNPATIATGWYRQTLNLNGCVRKDSLFATVKTMPATPIATYTSPVCAGEQLKLSATPVAGATYTWSGPNGFSSSQQNPVRNNIILSDAGNYNVTANIAGCISPAASVTVAINPLPFVVISTPKDSICKNAPVTFTALPNNAGANPQYRWAVNSQYAGTSALFNTTTLNDGDVITCEMTDAGKCSASFKDTSNTLQMTVLPWLPASVSITANPNGPIKDGDYITFTATPVNGGKLPQYQWKRNNQDVQGATSNVWGANTLNNNDVIRVDLISSYQCPQPATAASNDIKVQILTGVNDVDRNGYLSLYPNPNSGAFVLKGDLPVTGTVRVEVVNPVGQRVYTEIVQLTGNKINKDIQLGAVANGVYILKLYTTDGWIAIAKFNKL